MKDGQPMGLGFRGATNTHDTHPRLAGNTVIYTADGGSGGSGSEATCTGLGGSNGWLQLAYERVSPVRVIRSHRLQHSPYAPMSGMRYDGTYHVSRMEHVTQESGELCLKFTFERIRGQSRLPLRVAPATAASSSTRSAHRPVFVDLVERDERPRVWAISPTPDSSRRRNVPQDSSMQDATHDVPQAQQPWGGSETGDETAAGLTPPRRERTRMPTVRRAARGFPQAGVIGSPSAPRLGSTLPSHGYRRQVCGRHSLHAAVSWHSAGASWLTRTQALQRLHCQSDSTASP